MGSAWKLLRRLWARLRGRWRGSVVDDPPAQLGRRCVYLVTEDDLVWRMMLWCPCGCGATLDLNAVPNVRPTWRVEVHDDETVTLHPSINRQVGCRSHFFLRKGIVDWCD